MKIVSYQLLNSSSDSHFVGALVQDGAAILDFNATLQAAPLNPLAYFDLDSELFHKAAEVWTQINEDQSMAKALREQGLIIPRSDVRILAPVPRPNKLICVGLNYRDHAVESNLPIPASPVIFSKFTTAIIGSGESIVLPSLSQQVDYEAELAFVIGRRAKSVQREQAYDYVLGYTCFNDISERDFQFADGQWVRGKSCDTFAPMGECIVTKDEISDPHQLSIQLRLNGQTLQDSNTNQLIFGIPELVEFLSATITLEPGDVVATGTPPGVGFARKPPIYLQVGDVVEVAIEKIGILANPISNEFKNRT